MTKNEYFGPILAVLGPKILIFMGGSQSFGTEDPKAIWMEAWALIFQKVYGDTSIFDGLVFVSKEEAE